MRLPGRLAITLVALLAALTGFSSPTALAAPGIQDEPTYEELVAAVEQITTQVATAEDALARLTVEAEAAAEASRAAEDALATAQGEAAAAAAQLDEARAAVARAKDDIESLGRRMFMGSGDLRSAGVLLDASGPEEMLQRAVTLDLLGEDRAERLAAFDALQAQQAQADAVARAAVASAEEAAEVAAAADQAAQQQLASSRQAYEGVAAQKADLDQQFREANIRLLAAQGQTDAADAWDQQRRQQLAQQRAGTVALVDGRVTSCFGSRWGTTHYGIDIAAPIGTPIYVPADGVVLSAGPASGFGLAVAIQHDDGTITLYGHINRFTVSAGQQLTAGQQVAEVGNRGVSTGAHLHIETHTGGLYRNRVDPAPWLAARGIDTGCA